MIETQQTLIERRFWNATAQDILFERDSPGFISPLARVLSVGPGWIKPKDGNLDTHIALPMDPSLYILPPYLKTSLVINDLPAMCEKGDETNGFHNPKSVIETMTYLFAEAEIPIQPMQLVEGSFLDMPEDRKYDVIFDHMTTFGWIKILKSPKTLHKFISKIESLKSPGGIFLMFFKNCMGLPCTKRFSKTTVLDFETAFLAKGFKTIILYPIQDSYPLHPAIEKSLSYPEIIDLFYEDSLVFQPFYPKWRASGLMIAQ